MTTHIVCRDCRFEAITADRFADETVETHEAETDHEVVAECIDGGARLVTDGGEERELIEVCPHCDSTPIQTNSGGYGAANDPEGKHRCKTCGCHFDEPNTRPKKPVGGNRRGLAGQLAELSPDDVSDGDLVTDGGEDEYPEPEEMSLEALREEYSERADIGFSEPEEHDRTMALWHELRDRVDVEQPACPECGDGNWGQAPGEPVQCNSCGEYLGENAELRQEIQDAWNEIMGRVGERGGELVTDGGRNYALPGDDLWQRLHESDIGIGDVVVDLARGKSLQVVSAATQPAGEHKQVRSDPTAELFDTDADDLVFNCVFLPNQEDGISPPSKTYAYPESRLLRYPVEEATPNERLQREWLSNVLEHLAVVITKFEDDRQRQGVFRAVDEAFGEDVVETLEEFAEAQTGVSAGE